jgi:hypothetical protein
MVVVPCDRGCRIVRQRAQQNQKKLEGERKPCPLPSTFSGVQESNVKVLSKHTQNKIQTEATSLCVVSVL